MKVWKAQNMLQQFDQTVPQVHAHKQVGFGEKLRHSISQMPQHNCGNNPANRET